MFLSYSNVDKHNWLLTNKVYDEAGITGDEPSQGQELDQPQHNVGIYWGTLGLSNLKVTHQEACG